MLSSCPNVYSLRLGDWLTLLFAIALTGWLWVSGHTSQLAHVCQVRVHGKVTGTYDLNQDRKIHVHGILGESIIEIHAGKVRMAHSPCHNQYCVHQGWLSKAGETVLCLPNQISIQLPDQQSIDSLSY